MSVYDRLKSLNIELPPVAVPAAAYVPYVQTGNLVFLSGTSPRRMASPGSVSWARRWTRPKASRPHAPSPST